MNPNTPTGLEPDTGVRPPLPHETKTLPPRRRGRGWLWFIVFLVLAAGAYFYWQRRSAAPGGPATAVPEGTKTGKKGGRGAGGPPAVVAIKAKRGNIGVYVTGLGTVTPIYTVTVKSRVDGQLMDVHFKEGDIVQKGAPLVEIDPRPYEVALEQAEGQKARDQALLDNARVDQARYETLLKQNAIPEQQLATQKALVDQYIGTVKTDQGAIDSARLNIVYCHITSPITGRIGLRLVDPGNIVHATDANGLLVIAQIQPISVIFPISEKDLPAVRKRSHGGQGLKVDAWDPDGRFKIATGSLTTIDNQIDQTTGTVKLRATFENKDEALFPNQFTNDRLLVEEKTGVVLLQSAAVQRASQSAYVWLLKPDSTVTVRNITEGVVEGDQSEITSGLQPGDSVVMTGVDKLNEGSKVNFSYQDGSGRGGRGAAGANAPANAVPANSPVNGPGGSKGSSGKRSGGGRSSQ